MKDRLHSDITKSLANISEVKTVEINFGVMNEEQRNNVKKLIRGGREKFIPFAQPDSGSIDSDIFSITPITGCLIW